MAAGAQRKEADMQGRRECMENELDSYLQIPGRAQEPREREHVR